MTKFGDKTVLHVHVQVTSSFSQPLYLFNWVLSWNRKVACPIFNLTDYLKKKNTKNYENNNNNK